MTRAALIAAALALAACSEPEPPVQTVEWLPTAPPTCDIASIEPGNPVPEGC